MNKSGLFRSMIIFAFAIIAIYTFSSCAENPDFRTIEHSPSIPAMYGGRSAAVESGGENLYKTALYYGRRTASFIAAGDNVIHPGIYLDAQSRSTVDTRGYHFKPMYEEIAELIESADIAFINQETLMGGEELGYSGYPYFNSPRDLGYDLVEIGFDVINIANNHMLDKGVIGLENTIDFLTEQAEVLIGGYKNEADFGNIRLIERDGIIIALLSYTYGTNGLSLPASSKFIIPYLNEADIRSQSAHAKEIADALVVSVHWGEENWFNPTNEQKYFAAVMAECGADVIIGHHPHVLQPIEWLDRPDGGKTLCVYSLGNLVSEMMCGYNMVGGLIYFDIVCFEGVVTVENVIFYPTIFYYGMNFLNTRIYLMENFNESLAKKHGTQNYGHLDSYEKLKSYVTDNISSEFLPERLIK